MFGNKKTVLTDSVVALDQIIDLLESKSYLSMKDFDPKHTVLIVVDINNGFCKKGDMYSPRTEKLIEKIRKAMELCKALGIQIVMITDSHPQNAAEFENYPPHCEDGDWESEVVDELKAVGGYILITKNSTNGFIEDAFKEWLSQHPEITNMIIAGCVTDICMLQFIVVAKADYDRRNIKSRVIVPMELSDTFDNGLHKAELFNTMGFMIMSGCGAEIVKNITE